MPGKNKQFPNRKTRRKFLAQGAGAVLTFVLADSVLDLAATPADGKVQATQEVLARFYQISDILTGQHQIEKLVSDQAWFALCKKYQDFPGRFNLLQKAIVEARINDVEQFKGTVIFGDAALRRTAMDIVSAWYLGKVGEVKGESQVGGPEYVTYIDALLWRPTLNPGIIPSYSHGVPGWWGMLGDADLKV